jgi:hypothetical protein
MLPDPLSAELVIASRLFGAGLFFLAIRGKLLNWTPFLGVLASYRLLPGGTEAAAAIAILAAEAVVATSLATGIGLPYGGILGIALLLGFAVAMAVAMARGERVIDCGCFQSALRQRLTPGLILRNLVLAGLLLPTLATALPIGGASELVDGLAAGLALLLLNAAIATMIVLRDASAQLRGRYL